jgi:pentalenolactone synthase
LDIGSANHDPSAFDDPNRIDFARRAATHLSFGHGSRYCIGAPLARIELKTVFAQLIPRFPSMHLALEPAALEMRGDVLAGGLIELPVSW